MDVDDIILFGKDDSVIGELVDNNDSVASNVLLEDSFSSCLNSAATSTPRKPPFKAPVQPAPKKPRLSCPQCHKTYASEQTLGVHKKMHIMKGISSKIPSLSDLRGVVKKAFLSTPEEIEQEVVNSDIADYCGELLVILGSGGEGSGDNDVDFLNSSFHNILKSQNALLPSALRSAVFCCHNKLMSTDTFSKEFSKFLFDLKEASSEILNFISGYGTYKLFSKIFLEVLKLLQGKSLDCSKNPESKKRSNAE